MSKINPRIEDGEMVCDAACTSYECGGMMDRCEARKVRASHGLVSVVTDDGEPCVPGLRRQRDEALDTTVGQRSRIRKLEAEMACAEHDRLEAERERDEARRELCDLCAVVNGAMPLEYAMDREWSYLYYDCKNIKQTEKKGKKVTK